MINIETNEKTDNVVRTETTYIAVWTLIFSMIMQAVFLVLNKWDYTVLLGNLLGSAANLLNFYLMARTIASAVDKEEKEAKQLVKASYSMRMIMLFAVALVGILLSCFNTIAVIIPFFFTRVAIMLRPLFTKK